MLEKSLELKMLHDIAMCVQHWITASPSHSSGDALTDREKAALLLRMTRFERLGGELAASQVWFLPSILVFRFVRMFRGSGMTIL